MDRFNVVCIIALALLAGLISSCKKKDVGGVSNTTGWEFGNADNGGFTVADYVEQKTGPGLVLIEGGAFIMGQTQQDVMYDWNNFKRTVTVSSFYMDENEVSNVDYREYLYWTRRVFGEVYPEVYVKALPDTLVWRKPLAYNEPYVDYYFRHPAYNNYPVVGISWLQADNYCTWRTDRVNEQILVDEGILDHNPMDQQGDNNFNTEAYYAGQYEGQVRKKLPSNNPNDPEGGRNVTMEDGILLPKYQLPTEAEWEYAALAIIGNSIDERIYSRKLYPWNGHYMRNDTKENLGLMRANFQRGRGDMMGVAGYLNDNASITSPIDAYWPNDYGLYCMSGNVNEWVRDVFRQVSFVDVDGFNPFRGNVFKTILRNTDGTIEQKDSLGRIPFREVTLEESMNRENYQKADNINYNDGDIKSSIVPGGDWNAESGTEERGSNRMYNNGKNNKDANMSSMVNDHSRVYKGGSWQDRPYWLIPGTRRFLDESKSTRDIGFRCSMLRVGSPTGY